MRPCRGGTATGARSGCGSVKMVAGTKPDADPVRVISTPRVRRQLSSRALEMPCRRARAPSLEHVGEVVHLGDGKTNIVRCLHRTSNPSEAPRYAAPPQQKPIE